MQAFKAMQTSPAHLVISDLNMPGLDGIGLLKALREYRPTSKVGFILVTGVGRQGGHRPRAPIGLEQLPGQAVHGGRAQDVDRGSRRDSLQ